MGGLEQIRALYAYNEWANGHVLDAARGLSEHEFSRDLGASFGSVEGNLAHILAGQIVWLSRWRTGSNPESLAERQSIRGFGEIETSFAESHAGLRSYVSSLSEADLDRILSYTDSRGNPGKRRMGQLLLHVANHGTHHRAETAMLLTSLGKPPRQLDYVFFEQERE